jgi:hypothetical protein
MLSSHFGQVLHFGFLPCPLFPDLQPEETNMPDRTKRISTIRNFGFIDVKYCVIFGEDNPDMNAKKTKLSGLEPKCCPAYWWFYLKSVMQ